jgi:hypothetical protein
MIQTRRPEFDVIQSNEPLSLLYSNDLMFWLNAIFFSIQNGKVEFFGARKVHVRFRSLVLNFRRILTSAFCGSMHNRVAS